MARYSYDPGRMRRVSDKLDAVRLATAERAGMLAYMPLPPKLRGHGLGNEVEHLQKEFRKHGESGANILNNVAAELRVRANLAELADAGLTAKDIKNLKKLRKEGWEDLEVPAWFKNLSPAAQEALLAYGTPKMRQGGRLKTGWDKQPDGTRKWKVAVPGQKPDPQRESRQAAAGRVAKLLGKINKGVDLFEQTQAYYKALKTKGGLDDKAKAVFKVFKDNAVGNASSTAGTVLLGAGALALGAGPGLVIAAGLLGGYLGSKVAEYLAPKIAKIVGPVLESIYGATLGRLLDWAGIT